MGINKVMMRDGKTVIDLTGINVIPEVLKWGYSAINAAGELIEGILDKPGTETVLPITWKSGYTCNYDVGSVCVETAGGSYVISDNISVKSGKTYRVTNSEGTALVSASQIYFIELDKNDVILQRNILTPTLLGSGYDYKPSSEDVAQLKFRTYTSIEADVRKWILTEISGGVSLNPYISMLCGFFRKAFERRS